MSIQDCLSTYGCELQDRPKEGAVYTPYVKVIVGGETLLLSGNASAPIDEQKHHAMITSFQYGAQAGTGGCGCIIEVVDEGGVMYTKIWRALSKDITKTAEDAMKCQVIFGWIIKNCDGTEESVTNLDANDFPDGGGGPIHLIPRKMNASFDGGLVKFTLECVDTFAARSTESRLESNIGTEDGKVGMRAAQEEMFTEKDPSTTKVDFIDKTGRGPLKFRGDPDQGYFSVNNMDQESNVSCGRKWMNNTLSQENNGILLMYDPRFACTSFYEDPRAYLECCGQGHLGTYVVNGGNNSTVISFSPSTDWNFGANTGTGGVGSGGGSADNVKQKESDGIVQTGTQSQHLADGNQWHFSHPPDHASDSSFVYQQHNDATKDYEGMIAPVSAELKIIGNPTWVNPLFLTSHWISIVVINPYYIKGDTSTGDKCEWLAESNCNPILSNKKWLIQGIDHQITSGSYFTTLKVHLATPGVDIPAGEPLGGVGCGTETIPDIKTEPNF